MKAGLVGYSQSGKTTLFNALTGLHKGTGGIRGQVNLGAIKVPDPRIDALSAIFEPKKTTYAEMQFVDVPGPAGEVSGLDADGTPADPERELRDFDAELVLHDLALVEKRLDRLRKEGHRGTGEFHELERLHAQLDDGKPRRAMRWSDAEEKELVHFA